MQQTWINDYRKRLVREKIVTSLAFGLMVGAGADFLAALACYLFNFKGIWLPLTIGGGVFLLSSVLFYFLKFRPTERDVVRRVDTMGLDERAVTMYELKDEDSFIAKRQREDAVEKVAAVNKEQVKRAFPLFALKTWAVILLFTVFLSGAGMTTVAGLAGAGVIDSPDILPDKDRENFCIVSYLTEGQGDVEGEPEQTILAGEDATTVVAVADDGWMFTKWSDGVKDPARTDRKILEDLSVTAIFEEIAESSEDIDGEAGGDAEDGDADKNAPSDNNDSSAPAGDSGQGGEGDGNGDKGDGSGSGNGGQEGEGKGNGKGEGAGGGWSDGNQIIDGKTDYRDVRDLYYDQAMEIIRNGGELPDYLREFIEQYYGSI
ncbi:MAG TPA: hypothetical protein DDY70_03865 [Clostridiales bacterium]|nr:hypothetical protein [Clostridiales bacterium]